MDEAGAAAAAAYFVSLYSYTMRSGDTSRWDAMSWPDCGFCAGIKQDALASRASGATFEGGDIALSEITVLARDELVGGYPVDARFSQGTEVRRAPDGTILSTSEGDEGLVRIDTMPTSDGWKILAVVVSDA